MIAFKTALAVNYLRWMGILGVTAGIHAVAFCIYVEGGGKGEGPAVPEGRVSLCLTHTETPCAPLLTSLRSVERPVVERNRPVQIEHTLDSPGRLPTVPPRTNAPVAPTATCSLTQAASPDARTAASSTPHHRAAGANTSELDRPLCLGEGRIPPQIANGPTRCEGAHDTHASPPTINGRPAASTQSGKADTGEGVEAEFALDGKPVYPLGCRRGDCTGCRPCEGVSRWRITVNSPNTTPLRIERLHSTGCSRLDASVEDFLGKARIPRAGVFLLRFRFKLNSR